MTKKTEEKVESLSQSDFLKKQVEYLDSEINKKITEVEKAKASLNQLIGAKDFALGQLNLIESENKDEK